MKTYILIFAILLYRPVIAQNSFEVNYTGIDNEFLIYTFETTKGDFISIGGKKGVSTPLPLSQLIVKISKYGEIINELVYTKPDTNFVLQYGYEKANGNYFLIGTLTDTVLPNDYNVTYVCERAPDLSLVWEKFSAIPESYNNHRISNFIIDADSNLFIQGSIDTVYSGYNYRLLTMIFDKNGNRLNINFYEGWKSPSSTNEMIFNFDSTAICFIGNYVRNELYTTEFIEMDLELNITDYISVIDEEHFAVPPVTVKVFKNSNYIQANKASMEPGTDQDLYIKIMDEELNTLRDTLLFYPEKIEIPSYIGMGFIDTNRIWVPTFQPEFNFIPGTEVFRFHIFDTNLNLIGLKEYGGDRRYWFNNMIVTSDGGCLLTGRIPDYNGSHKDNSYIIKVMPEDIITHAEDTSFINDKDVLVYPNPFDTEIRFQTVRKDLNLDLFDITGKQVLSGNIFDHSESAFATAGLIRGIYFYTIRDDNRIIQSGKLIKK
ncbi:MAG: T9SS type A sorting domain-containing protein [Bacteroidales bacterium]|nr:T9SS type A sorting domain-containing protein [Bacteroidales bacterium]